MAQESFIRIDLPGFGVTSPHAPFNRVASSFLAGTVGLLRQKLGEAGAGLCYDLFSDTAQFAHFGQVSFGAACTTETVHKMQAVIVETITRLHETPPVGSAEWERLKAETERDVQMLLGNPYDLFDFLLTEAHPLALNNPDPHTLLNPWSQKERDAVEALKTIFDPAKMSVGLM